MEKYRCDAKSACWILSTELSATATMVMVISQKPAECWNVEFLCWTIKLETQVAIPPTKPSKPAQGRQHLDDYDYDYDGLNQNDYKPDDYDGRDITITIIIMTRHC